MIHQVFTMLLLHIKMILVFIVPMIPLVVSFGSQCGSLDRNMLPAENRILKNFTYGKKTVPRYVICGRDCSTDKDCKSFNFYKCNKLCELNNATRAEHPESFIIGRGSVYFDKDEGTPLLSLPNISFAHNRSCKGLIDADWSGEVAFAKYKNFNNSESGDNYTLNIGEYDVSSTAGDSLTYHNGRPFTTKDIDNDEWSGQNCAIHRKGAWWFRKCHYAHLNGHYYPDGQYQSNNGIVWYHWQKVKIPLKASIMKMRQTDI